MTLSERCIVHARKASEEGWHTTEGVLLQASIELEQRDELLWFAKQILESGDNIKIESPSSDETLANILARGRKAVAKAEA
jgi:hypothetical protein